MPKQFVKWFGPQAKCSGFTHIFARQSERKHATIV